MADKLILQPRSVQDEAAKLSRAHAESLDQLMQDRGFPDEKTRQIYVKPAGGRPVAMGGGQFYPMEGMYVSANDVYTARRLRDGSLEQVDPPEPIDETESIEEGDLKLPSEEEMPLTEEEVRR
jgi:hypothetical protein